MASVRSLDGLIRERVKALLKRFSEFRDTGDVLMMSWAFAAFTNGKSGMSMKVGGYSTL